MTSVIEQLKKFVAEELVTHGDGTTFSEDENLLASGLVDSIGMMRLVAFIDDVLAIKVPPEDVTIENFITLKAIAEYLGRRTR
jgi:acyl carrier protein